MNTQNIEKGTDTLKTGEGFAEMLYNRIDGGTMRQELEQSEQQIETIKAFDELRETLKEALPADMQGKLQELSNVHYRLLNMEANYFYRVGLQEGIHILSTNFLTEGIL
jgi:hypothetical protein